MPLRRALGRGYSSGWTIVVSFLNTSDYYLRYTVACLRSGEIWFYTQFNNKVDISFLTWGGLTYYLMAIEKTSPLVEKVTLNEDDKPNYRSIFHVPGACPSFRRDVCMKWFTFHWDAVGTNRRQTLTIVCFDNFYWRTIACLLGVGWKVQPEISIVNIIIVLLSLSFAKPVNWLSGLTFRSR